jgi:Zn-dependent metalloprotease
MIIKLICRTTLGLLLSFAVALVNAADLNNLRQDTEILARVKSLTSDTADPAFRRALGLSADESLEVLRSYDNGVDGTITRYRQTFRGVPIWGEQIIIGRDAAGRVKSLNGRLISGLASELLLLQPSFSDEDVLSRMKSKVEAKFNNILSFYNEASELVIYIDNKTAKLSYAVSFFADSDLGGHPTRPTFIIDALTSDILLEYEGLTHADPDCSTNCTLLDISDLSGNKRQWQYHQFTVPNTLSASGNQLLEISISGGSGDADLYTRLGIDPTSNTWDCRSASADNNETCSTVPSAGDEWHIGIFPYRKFSGVNLVVTIKQQSYVLGTGPGGNNKTGKYYYGNDGIPETPDFGSLKVLDSNGNGTCTMSNANVKTVDLNHGISGSTAYDYTCLENTHKSINGAFSPLNDAHYFGGVVYDMYQDYLGISPLTFQLSMRVHYSNNYENAFWNGSSMTFGDGYSTFYPLVSLDVSAHEVSHGFTEQNSNLTYSGESGGINEAFSDIAGEAAEFYMYGNNDFLVGAQIIKASGGALRNTCNPSGSSIGHVEDYFNGLDVHYSSGIYNKAFCLLAKTEDWDTQSAFQAFARANQWCWTNSTNFVDGAQCVVDVVAGVITDTTLDESYHGLNPQDVVNAFEVVGITGLQLPGTPPPTTTDITLTLLDSYKIRSVMHAILEWDVSITGIVIKRNGIEVDSCQISNNETTCDDSIGKGSGTFVYEVCAPVDGDTTTCSNNVTATF